MSLCACQNPVHGSDSPPPTLPTNQLPEVPRGGIVGQGKPNIHINILGGTVSETNQISLSGTNRTCPWNKLTSSLAQNCSPLLNCAQEICHFVEFMGEVCPWDTCPVRGAREVLMCYCFVLLPRFSCGLENPEAH